MPAGQTTPPAFGAQLIVGSALFKVVDGTAKFVKLKMLKISVRNSRFVDSVIGKRLFRTRSNCLKFGPRSALRGRSPNVPGSGIENAAGLIRLRSLFRYGLTPGTMFGRRTFRDAPPPGVLTTPMKPTGSVPLVSWATNPCDTVVATPLIDTGQVVSAHCITTSGRVMPISIGSPLRALMMPPIAQSPSNAFPLANGSLYSALKL